MKKTNMSYAGSVVLGALAVAYCGVGGGGRNL